MPRGGKRAGAGRKRVEEKLVSRSFALGNWELQEIADYALTHNISESEALRRALQAGIPILRASTLFD